MTYILPFAHAYGGAGGSRTRVLDAFISKELQPYLSILPVSGAPDYPRKVMLQATPHILIKWRVVC
jgi:hypothetical protein